MMLVIPEDILQAAKMDEHGMLVELACHLFDKDYLSLGQGARMAGLTRTAFEEALFVRGIPAYRYELADFEADMRVLDDLNRRGK
jgi:predicted HTH domain antitoxin